MKWLALMLLSGCICAPTPDDFRPAHNPPPYIWLCDDDGGPCMPYDVVCVEADCRAIPVVEL